MYDVHDAGYISTPGGLRLATRSFTVEQPSVHRFEDRRRRSVVHCYNRDNPQNIVHDPYHPSSGQSETMKSGKQFQPLGWVTPELN